MSMFLKKLAIFFICTVILIFSGCSKIREHSFFALDTAINIKCSDKSAREIENLILKYEKILSVTDEESEVFRLNNNITKTVSDEFKAVFNEAEKISRKTGGTFSFAVYPLVHMWGFTTKNYKVLTHEEISEILPKTDFKDFYLSDNILIKPEGGMMDFGAIAKGYICDEAVKILKENGEGNAIISMGGNVYAHGNKDGDGWSVAIRSPFSEEYAGILKVSDKAVVTSGDYERFFVKDGEKYHHILNPATGFPTDNTLKSVTIVADSATLADGYSTALFVMGYEKAMEFYEKEKNFEAIFIFENGEIYVTENLRDSFEKK